MEAISVVFAIAISFASGWLLGHYKSPKAVEVAAQSKVADFEKDVAPYLEDAKRLIQEADQKFKDVSGEFKRHQVFADLLKLHPIAKASDLALAIEVAFKRLFNA